MVFRIFFVLLPNIEVIAKEEEISEIGMVYSNEMPIFAFEKSSKFQRSYGKRTFYR